MDVKNSFEMNHDYDAQNDSLFLYIIDDYIYKRSLRLDKDLILDFDVNNVPVALEILHASKKLNTSKLNLRQPIGLNMEVVIARDFIHIKADFTIVVRNKSTPLDLDVEGENSINLPSQEAHFEKAAA
jgi:Uncharacterized conserved small protein